MAQYKQECPQYAEQPQYHTHQQYQQYQQQQPPNYMPQQPHIAHTYQSPQVTSQQEKPQPHGHQHQHQHDHDQDLKPKGSKKWAFGLFDCFSPFSTCCVSFWCPCYLFGKTYERNKTGSKDPNGMNGMCAAYCLTLCCGCAPILQCMERQNQREKHGIDGGMFGDFCTACCCSCCALIQEEKESVVRTTGVDPTTGVAYQPVKQMTYP